MSTIAKKIVEEQADGMRLFATRVATKDLLTIEGSILGGPTTLPHGKGAIAGLTAELLDAGTKKHKKNAFRKLLADKGVSISFSSAGERLYFSASALPEDYEFVLSLIAECLSQASFDEKEVTFAKERALGDLQEASTDTRIQASIALSRVLFTPEHPNYAESIEETKKALKKISRNDLISHHSRLGKDGLFVAVVGDIDPKTSIKKAMRIFSKLPAGSIKPNRRNIEIHSVKRIEKRVTIADKANIDSYFGSTFTFPATDSRYYPLSVAVSMLGGRGLSTGHLMRTIRERDGLTYGIYGALAGFDDFNTGYFRIWATFAPAVFTKAVLRVREEIAIFLKIGMTDKALATKKTELTGSYQVSLATSHGLASALHAIAKQGKKLSFIDEYPLLIQSITLAQVKSASKLLQPNSLALTASGSFCD